MLELRGFFFVPGAGLKCDATAAFLCVVCLVPRVVDMYGYMYMA